MHKKAIKLMYIFCDLGHKSSHRTTLWIACRLVFSTGHLRIGHVAKNKNQQLTHLLYARNDNRPAD